MLGQTNGGADEPKAHQVRELWERHWNEGLGYRSLALDFNARRVPAPRAGKRGSGVWTARLVCDITNNERYLGKIEYGAVEKRYKKGTKVRIQREAKDVMVLDAPHLRIVSAEVERAYRAARSTLDSAKMNDTTQRGPKPRHLLAGIARCGVCGGTMHGQIGRGGVRYYRCGRNRMPVTPSATTHSSAPSPRRTGR